ncbi:excinuclease ABC subunit UvrB [candidate division TA06 bacterium]|uniref:UvrABC system protein B n=2 Tax=candidate division TA06 bacterium TaxID=2250710 RepID=A0A523UP51_UNCT6|nr:MAG: excinuclease ABC subunit UvrB [candidate division TA06 bacterium]
MGEFEVVSDFKPTGDQPEAIKQLVRGIERGQRCQTLLGVTGSGKTFTIANVIAKVQKPTLIFSHNKTLAAQLYGEFTGFFPHNAVEYFISYYDYYQPEAYVPQTDTYIEKDASINDDIERLRLKATTSLLERRDVVIVASVSCIYNIGAPQEFMAKLISLELDQEMERDDLLRSLVDLQYVRNDLDFARGSFRVRGDVVDIHLAYEKKGVRVVFDGSRIADVYEIDVLKGQEIEKKIKVLIYPAKHFLTNYPAVSHALKNIEKELGERVAEFKSAGKLLEAQRLETRTRYDMEMLKEVGYCPGIENYSRQLDGRKPGERPSCLLDYFPRDFLLVIDESHVTIPQIVGMYHGDRSRKETLVEYGFRLPSALDNRPLKFEEFESLINEVIFVSATPAEFELKKCKGVVVEQIIRPTGLVDPKVSIKPAENQIDDLLEQIRKRVENKERVLVTTLTKRMAEDLADYLRGLGIKVRYMHSEIGAIERVEILRGLRLADFDVLVGINLLREGLDLPEVSLVAILDADKEGFLRSETSLVQTAGRAARNLAGEVLLYADKITGSMERALKEMERRRKKQVKYNKKYEIKPRSIVKSVDEVMRATSVADAKELEKVGEEKEDYVTDLDRLDAIDRLRQEMKQAADELEFEKAARLRDRIRKIEAEIRLGGSSWMRRK